MKHSKFEDILQIQGRNFPCTLIVEMWNGVAVPLTGKINVSYCLSARNERISSFNSNESDHLPMYSLRS